MHVCFWRAWNNDWYLLFRMVCLAWCGAQYRMEVISMGRSNRSPFCQRHHQISGDRGCLPRYLSLWESMPRMGPKKLVSAKEMMILYLWRGRGARVAGEILSSPLILLLKRMYGFVKISTASHVYEIVIAYQIPLYIHWHYSLIVYLHCYKICWKY